MKEKKENKAPKGVKVVKIKKSLIHHKFFLAECQEDADLGKLADELIAIKNVKEVNIGEGSDGYGILIKTTLEEGKDYDEFLKFLNKRLKGKYGKLVSYYSVKK